MTGPRQRAAWHRFGPLLHGPAAGGLWAGRLMERSGDWILLIAALALAWDLTADPAVVAVLILVRIVPRAVLLITGLPAEARRIAAKLFFLITPMRAVLAAGLVLLADADGLPWLLAAVAANAALWALADAVRVESVALLVPRLVLGRAVLLDATTERIAIVLGPASAWLILTISGVQAALAAAGLLLAGASVLVLGRTGLVAWLRAGSAASATGREDIHPARRPAWDLVKAHPTLTLMAAGSFAAGALCTSLIIVLLVITTERLGGPASWLGWLLAVVGLGTLIGPVAMIRMLAHVTAQLLIAAAVTMTAAGVVVIGLTSSLLVVLISLFALGLVAVNADAIVATVTRRLTAADRLADTSRAMLSASVCGQATGALVFVATTSRDVADVSLILSAASVVLVGALLIVGRPAIESSNVVRQDGAGRDKTSADGAAHGRPT